MIYFSSYLNLGEKAVGQVSNLPHPHSSRQPQLSRENTAATIPADKQLYQRQIEATDRQIDALVYELYGPTEEEADDKHPSQLWGAFGPRKSERVSLFS